MQQPKELNDISVDMTVPQLQAGKRSKTFTRQVSLTKMIQDERNRALNEESKAMRILTSSKIPTTDHVRERRTDLVWIG